MGGVELSLDDPAVAHDHRIRGDDLAVEFTIDTNRSFCIYIPGELTIVAENRAYCCLLIGSLFPKHDILPPIQGFDLIRS